MLWLVVGGIIKRLINNVEGGNMVVKGVIHIFYPQEEQTGNIHTLKYRQGAPQRKWWVMGGGVGEGITP